MSHDTSERARVQREYARQERAQRWRRQSIGQRQRDGELLFVFPDADRHERRIQRAVLSRHDRLFWITIAIACGSPGRASKAIGSGDNLLAKEFGHLQLARNDLAAFYEYYRPTQIGDPFTIAPAVPGLMKSPGYFDRAVRLDNPTVTQLQASVENLREWIAINQDDPEYTSFQLNFIFSGHGDVEDDSAFIVLADQKLPASKLAALLLNSIPAHDVKPAQCRLDLYLDCCRAGAVAHELSLALSELQSNVNRRHRSVLEFGQVYCACLGEEQSYELDDVAHGVFTFAFLNECSRKAPEGAATRNLGLRDVGWYTRGLQHPLLLDFTATGGSLKFPSMYHVPSRNKGKLAKLLAASAPEAGDPIGRCLAHAKVLKDACASAEKKLWRGQVTGVPFSREELLTNEKFPFL